MPCGARVPCHEGAGGGVEEGEALAARQPRGDVVGKRVAALPDDDLGAVLAQCRCLRAAQTVSIFTHI